jgi:uncharacterized protein YxeA
MPQDATIILIVFAIMMFAFIGFAFFIIKTINKDKKNRLRKELLVELRDKDPNIEHTILFDLIDRTIL